MFRQKNIGYFPFLFFILIFVGACRGDITDLEMKTYSYDKVFNLSSDSTFGSLNISIETELPYSFSNKEVLENVKKQLVAKVFGEVFNYVATDSVILKYATAIKNRYYSTNRPILDSMLLNSDTLNREFENFFNFNNEIDIQGIALYSDDKILSYNYERYIYLGGAHGMNSRTILNFDLKTSKLFGENDIFVSNYKDSLTQLIKQQIIDDNVDNGSISDLMDFNYFEDKIAPNNNFYITAEGITYIFNPFEIAPYSTGQTAVTISYQKLLPLFKAGNIIEYIYKTEQ